jgi:hypothetical protein
MVSLRRGFVVVMLAKMATLAKLATHSPAGDRLRQMAERKERHDGAQG